MKDRQRGRQKESREHGRQTVNERVGARDKIESRSRNKNMNHGVDHTATIMASIQSMENQYLRRKVRAGAQAAALLVSVEHLHVSILAVEEALVGAPIPERTPRATVEGGRQ